MAVEQVPANNAQNVQPSPSNVHINPAYPAGQLQAALAAAERAAQSTSTSQDQASSAEQDAARHAAAQRIRKWTDVLHGMATGEVCVGSRQPVKSMPIWVTPEVVRGGFATGQAAAGGALQPHEVSLARTAGIGTHRRALAAYYMTDAGLSHLRGMLETGAYKITFPEEAAFPVVAWLLAQGDEAGAITLLDTLMPHMASLCFAPAPAPPSEAPAVSNWAPEAPCIIDTLHIHRFKAQHTTEALQGLRVNREISKNHEAITVWAPFYDDVLSLWLQVLTETGELPEKPLPQEWCARAGVLTARYQLLESIHTYCKKHKNAQRNSAVLRMALAQAVSQNGMLPPATRRQVTYRISGMLQKRGRPGEANLHALRTAQAACVRVPLYTHLAKILALRISRLQLSVDQGIPKASLPELLQPVTATEASAAEKRSHWNVREGSQIPTALKSRLERAVSAPLPDLIQYGVVPSGEALAELVPKLAAAGTAAQYSDPTLARLMAGLAAAFSARRSLLLLHLQSQVKVTELPWHAAVAGYADPGRVVGVTRELLKRLAEAALHAFPEVVLPNPLLKQLSTLARFTAGENSASNGENAQRSAGGTADGGETVGNNKDVVLLEELAADIFEDAFSGKFAVAARQAAMMLQGSAYERYYGLDYSAVLERVPHPTIKGSSVEFYHVCEELAVVCGLEQAQSDNQVYRRVYRRVAENGMVIEQAQILSTHNLAMLVGRAGVTAEAVGGWGVLAQRCAKAVCTLVGTARGAKDFQARLRWAKRAAYAWRQMVFFLTMEEDHAKHALALNELRQARGNISSVLQPHLKRLEAALMQDDVAWHSRTGEGEHGKPLVGWCNGPHSLLQ